jgi:hypothetical protein
MDERFCRLLVDPGDGHGKRGRQHEGIGFIPAKADLGDDFYFLIGKLVARLPTDAKERVFEARRIAAGEELLGIGGASFSAKGRGQCQVEVEKSVIAMDRTVSTSGGRHFR